MVLPTATRHHLEANRPDLALELYRYRLAERFQTGPVATQDSAKEENQ